MEYGAVSESEISKTIDKFVDLLGEPKPESLENPFWFNSVDESFATVLDSNNVTVLG